MDYAAAVEVFFTPTPDHIDTPQVVAAATPARRLRDALVPISMHDVWSASVNAAIAERGLDFFPRLRRRPGRTARRGALRRRGGDVRRVRSGDDRRHVDGGLRQAAAEGDVGA